ncbi:glycosyltransferase family 25 protein [Sphingomonas sanguinis]|uniref:glycosyltransferase family 25 protein n=1 Tax=Sphingomonas sp. LC-1 TaxID=3110957 RepID=UPI0021BA61CC|nr:glycosyltransferase family 25 protein [Sphingomonas sp. LC-1]MCT8000338.1 glycosyltransferase family 25 protein [Sphingomonas sp. LC-1]
MARTSIYVVSLDSATERRASFTGHAEGAGLTWRFFDAHREPQGLRYDEAAAIREHGRPLQAGELGCYSSHAGLWRQLLSDPDADQYLILEDDVIADWGALRLLCDVDYAAEGVDYMRLFYKKPSPHLPWRRNWPASDLYVVRLYGKPYGTQGYFITRKGAERFLELYTDAVRPVDDQMDRFWESGIPNLCLFPFPIMEAYRPSTIGAARFAGKQTRGARMRLTADRMRRKLAFMVDRTLKR